MRKHTLVLILLMAGLFYLPTPHSTAWATEPKTVRVCSVETPFEPKTEETPSELQGFLQTARGNLQTFAGKICLVVVVKKLTPTPTGLWVHTSIFTESYNEIVHYEVPAVLNGGIIRYTLELESLWPCKTLNFFFEVQSDAWYGEASCVNAAGKNVSTLVLTEIGVAGAAGK